VHYRNVIPTTGSCGPASSPVEQLDSSCSVSTDATLLPLMTSVSSSHAIVAHCSSAVNTTTTDTLSLTLVSGDNVSSAELNNSEYTVHSSRNETIKTGNMYEGRRGCKQFSPKSRIRRTQLKMLADNLSKFYAPATGSKRRELLAWKRSAIDVERSARERQLEVIRKQVSLVEKRKKVELEMAAVASHDDLSEPDSRSVHNADGVSADSVSKPATARFSARLSRKLNRWKTKRSKFAMKRKQKLSSASADSCEEKVPSSSESTLFRLMFDVE